MRRRLLLPIGLAIVLSLPATQAVPASVRTCDQVLLGKTKANGRAFAVQIRARRVGCARARQVAREWGRQNVGLGRAALPRGWRCGAGGYCRKGRRRVSYALSFPDPGGG